MVYFLKNLVGSFPASWNSHILLKFHKSHWVVNIYAILPADGHIYVFLVFSCWDGGTNFKKNLHFSTFSQLLVESFCLHTIFLITVNLIHIHIYRGRISKSDYRDVNFIVVYIITAAASCEFESLVVSCNHHDYQDVNFIVVCIITAAAVGDLQSSWFLGCKFYSGLYNHCCRWWWFRITGGDLLYYV